MNKLILGDAYAEMERLIDEGIKFNAIITDPPYGITNNQWDKQLDFKRFWELIAKLRQSAQTPIIIFGDFPFSVDLISSNRKWYRYTWYWNKVIGTGFLDSSYKPLKVIEHIHCFIEKPYKQILTQQTWKKIDRIANFYPQFTTGSKNHGTGNKLAGNIGSTYKSHRTHNQIKSLLLTKDDSYRQDLALLGKKDTDKHPKNYLKFQKPKSYVGHKLHPTEKPLELLEYLVKTYTQENDLVLDPFMGNGSTVLACKNLNRNYFGIENNEVYFNNSKGKGE